MDRRSVLKGLGGVMVLAVGGGIYRASDQGVFSVGEGPAYEPWHTWDTDSASGPLAIVHAGVLAANPHNTQPWLFHVAENRIDLYADPTRHLQSMDAFGREMHIGLGCALANMSLAAAAEGLAFEVELSPGRTHVSRQDKPLLVATLKLTPGEKKIHPSYHQISHRHTNRGPYDLTRQIDEDLLWRFVALSMQSPFVRLDIVSSDPKKTAISDTIIAATEAIVADQAMVMASEEWFRHDWDELQAHKDGVTMDATGASTLMSAMAKVMPKLDPDTNHGYWLAATRDVHTKTATAYGIISVRDLYDRPQNMTVGHVWQTVQLHATELGIAMQPLNQPLEIVDRMAEKGESVPSGVSLNSFVDDGWFPTFCFRMGYPTMAANASPRRGIDDVMMKA